MRRYIMVSGLFLSLLARIQLGRWVRGGSVVVAGVERRVGESAGRVVGGGGKGRRARKGEGGAPPNRRRSRKGPGVASVMSPPCSTPPLKFATTEDRPRGL